LPRLARGFFSDERNRKSAAAFGRGTGFRVMVKIALLLMSIGVLVAGGATALQPGKAQKVNGGQLVIVYTTVPEPRPLAESPPRRSCGQCGSAR
jgi:hypothetical protein